MKFEKGDMVWCRQYGYGEVSNVYEGTNFPVSVMYGKDKVRNYTPSGVPYLTSDDHIIHARERWKEEVGFVIMCLMSFAGGLAVGSMSPWV